MLLGGWESDIFQDKVAIVGTSHDHQLFYKGNLTKINQIDYYFFLVLLEIYLNFLILHLSFLDYWSSCQKN